MDFLGGHHLLDGDADGLAAAEEAVQEGQHAHLAYHVEAYLWSCGRAGFF